MMKTPKQKIKMWKWSGMFSIIMLIGIVFSCNDEVMDDLMETTTQMQLPNELKEQLIIAQKKYPDAEFIYLEVDMQNQNQMQQLKDLDPKSIAFIKGWPDRERVGALVNKDGPLKNAPIKSEDGVFKIVEEPASPKGGYEAFYAELSKKLEYTQKARDAGAQGTVYVQFVINPDGKITDAQVVRGIGYGLDEVALEAIKSSSEWNPPLQKGTAVKQRIVMPVKFSLEDSEREDVKNGDEPGNPFKIEVVQDEVVNDGREMVVSIEKSFNNGKTLIKGSVVDLEGEPVSGASVVNVGTTWGTVTNKQGEFTFITDQSSGKLSISFVGYERVVVNY